MGVVEVLKTLNWCIFFLQVGLVHSALLLLFEAQFIKRCVYFMMIVKFREYH